jgi:hypothetical protein
MVSLEKLDNMVQALRQLKSEEDVFSHPLFGEEEVEVPVESKECFDIDLVSNFVQDSVLETPKESSNVELQEIKELSILLNRQSDRFGVLLNEVNDYRKKFDLMEANLDSVRKSIPTREHVDKKEFKETKDHFNKIFAQTLRSVHDMRNDVSRFKDVAHQKSVVTNFDSSSLDHLNNFKKVQSQFNKKLKNNFKVLNNVLLQETEGFHDRLERLEKKIDA